MGLGNEAIPLTIAIGSPSSALVLYLYTKSIKKYGAETTLRVSNIICTLMMLLMFLGCSKLNGVVGKAAVVSFYAFREIYVSLLSSQHWAFIASTLDRSTSSYIVSFSGVVSVASAIGGCSIEQIVGFGGVHFLLFTALLSTMGSFLCAELARLLIGSESNGHSSGSTAAAATTSKGTTTAATAENIVTAAAVDTANGNSNETKPRHQQHHHHQHHQRHHHRSSSVGSDGKPKKRGGFWIDSWNLIWKHRLLQILFFEAITHQLCGNMLNLMFHNGLRSEVTDNSKRAMLVGRFFATVNIVACGLQCFVLPNMLHQSTLSSVVMKIPFLVLIGVALGVIQPGLISVMLGFGTIKVLEYSIMHSASEMIYMPMDHDVRYLGKELIKFFGHKLGRSGASLVLSALVSQVNPSLRMQSIWGAALTLFWGGSMFVLSEHLGEREQLLLLNSNRKSDAVAAVATTTTTTTAAESPAKAAAVSDGSAFVRKLAQEPSLPAQEAAVDNDDAFGLQPVVRVREDQYSQIPIIAPAAMRKTESTSSDSVSPALTHYSAATTASCTTSAYATHQSFQSIQSTDSLLSRGTYYTDSEFYGEDDGYDDSSYTDASVHSGRLSGGPLLEGHMGEEEGDALRGYAEDDTDKPTGRTMFVSQQPQQRRRGSSDSADENQCGLCLDEEDTAVSGDAAAAAAAASLARNTMRNAAARSLIRRRRHRKTRIPMDMPQEPPIMLKIGSEQVSLNRLGREQMALRRRARRENGGGM